MTNDENLIIIGASTRAAAFSALRAGMKPWCIDLFADADLQARCPVMPIDSSRYPRGFVGMLRQAPPGAFMYTGGLENHSTLIAKLAGQRQLWGNSARSLEIVRDPDLLLGLFLSAEVAYPDFLRYPPSDDEAGLWLQKPLAGSGGAGIAIWDGRNTPPRSRVFYQRRLEGESRSAIYVGLDGKSRFLGVTRQLVGEPWLNAAAFSYCGSIGPLKVNPAEREHYERIGTVLVEKAGLRGLFGVDVIQVGDDPFPVEVNPRYTASVEVSEFATGRPYMWWHRLAFEPDAPAPGPIFQLRSVIGKAILFARDTFYFPSDGPWRDAVAGATPIESLPEFADIPQANSKIERGSPILSFFVAGSTQEDTLANLQLKAAQLEEVLYPCGGAL